jgi:hypothetical protein
MCGSNFRPLECSMYKEPVEGIDFPKIGEETYIGDGLYASFDGWHIHLRAPRGDVDHFVGLEPAVFKQMMKWINKYPALANHVGVK